MTEVISTPSFGRVPQMYQLNRTRTIRSVGFLFLILVGFAQIGSAQMRAYVSYEGEMKPIVDVSRKHFLVVDEGRKKQVSRGAFDLRPEAAFAEGFVTISEVEVNLDPLRDASAKERAKPNSIKFRYTAEVTADRSLSDVFGVLSFVNDGSPGTYLVELGSLRSGRSKKVEIELTSHLDAVGSLHLFSKGFEVRGTDAPEAYDAKNYFKKLGSKGQGVPALELVHSERSFAHTLSQSGRFLATTRERDNRNAIMVIDLESMQLSHEVLVDHKDATTRPYYLTWVGDHAVAFVSGRKLWVFDLVQGTYTMVKEDVTQILNAVPNRPEVLVIITGNYNRGYWAVSFDTTNQTTFNLDDMGYGNIYFDNDGNARLRYRNLESRIACYYRPTPEGIWRELDDDVKTPGLRFSYKPGEYLERNAEVGAVGPDGDTLYISTRVDSDTFKLSSFSMSKGEVVADIAQLKRYDLSYSSGGNYRLLFDKVNQRLIGLVYEGATTQVVWLDPRFKAIQSQIDQALPGNVNLPIEWSAGGESMVYYSFSTRDPGTVYVFKPKLGQLIPVMEYGTALKSRTLAETKPIVFNARDNERVYGYLTAPAEPTTEPAPLVVIVHGGPTARDVSRFDPSVHYLSTRGYYVLQVNYRGSSGYGMKYQLAGLRSRLDGVVIDDVADGTRFAMGNHPIDPQRVAIMGASFGGWATYISLAKYPELYRAGIAVSAVSHWRSVQKDVRWTNDNKFGFRYWRSLLDEQGFDENEQYIDPLLRAGEITQPVLIVHGELDRIVDASEAGDMLKALQKNNAEVESLSLPAAGHGGWSEKDNVTYLNEVGRFLEQRLAPEQL